jgi:hypothetical protein
LISGNQFSNTREIIRIGWDPTGFHDDSRVTIRDNLFDGSGATADGVGLFEAKYAVVENNRFVNCLSLPIFFKDGTYGVIRGNYIEGWNSDTSNTKYNAIRVEASPSTGVTDQHVIIDGNWINNVNGVTAGTVVYVKDRRNVHIVNNVFRDSPRVDHILTVEDRCWGLKICNNTFYGAFVHAVRLDNTVGVGNASEMGACISNNRFYGNNNLGADIIIDGFHRGQIVGNHHSNGGTASGAAVYIENAGINDCWTISGNTIFGRNGHGPAGQGSGVYNLYGESHSVVGNTFSECGDTTNAAFTSYIIRMQDNGGTVIGNTISQTKGPQNSSGISKLIYCEATNNCVVGNMIYQDLSDVDITDGNFYGIDCNFPNNVFMGNCFRIVSTFSGLYARGIYTDGHNQLVISGNVSGSGSWGTGQFIQGIANTDNVAAIGNIGVGIVMNGAGGCVIGNVDPAGAVTTGSHLTTGNS